MPKHKKQKINHNHYQYQTSHQQPHGVANGHKPNSGGFRQQKPLSQAEIWDDSALIRVWNEAQAEYDFYHSIYARGEDVDAILRQAEAGEEEDEAAAVTPSNPTPRAVDEDLNDDIADDDELEDGELEEGEMGEDSTAPVAREAVLTQQRPQIGPQMLPPTLEASTTVASATTAQLPAPDQTLENLKMAYYWAGYYSGLYDGQRQAATAASLNANKGVDAIDTTGESKPF